MAETVVAMVLMFLLAGTFRDLSDASVMLTEQLVLLLADMQALRLAELVWFLVFVFLLTEMMLFQRAQMSFLIF